MLAMPLMAGRAQAAVIVWTGAVDANWSTATSPTNWNPNIPANNDSLVFDDTGANPTNTDDLAGLSVSGVTFNGAVNAFTLNPATGVSLTLTGGATAMVNNSSQTQTVNIPLNFGAATTLTGGANAAAGLKLNGAINNTLTTGNATLSFSGVGVVTDSFTTAGGGTTIGAPNAGDSWTIVDNAASTAITLPTASIITSAGALTFGTATTAPNLTITATASGGDHTIGQDAGVGVLNMVSGTLLLKTRLNTKNGNVNVSGGDLQIWNQFQMANSSLSETSTVTVSGGLLEVRNSSGSVAGGPIFVASRGMGTLTVNGGNVVCSNLDISRGAGAAVNGVASQGVVNLNGGVITCNVVTSASANTSGTGAGATAIFNFNGGTLKAKQNQAAFIRNSSGSGTNVPVSYIVKAGGAIIDTSAFAVATSENLQHDSTLGATADGGLTVLASGSPPGSLQLNSLCSYTGPTTIKGGTLILSSSTLNSNIASSSSIIVGDSFADSAAGLTVSGITAPGGFKLSSGQRLGGFGTITGAVSAPGGSFVGPGNSIGTLTENTSLALAGTLNIDLNDSDPSVVDLLNDVGNLDISAPTSTVAFNITGTPSAAAYVFAKYGTLTGTAFGTVNNLPAGYTINYNYQGGNQIALVSNVPEPGIAALAIVGVFGTSLRRRRR